MKRLAAAVIGLTLLCACPAGALSYTDYTPAEMRRMEARARAGDVGAMVDLGKAHAYGRAPGDKKDRLSAVYWFRKAADTGSAEAQTALGQIYYDRSDPNHPYDETRALLWFMRAVEKGDVSAQGYLADIFETSATRADYRKGYQWTLKAALQGDDNAVVRLQTLYVHRDEVTTFEAALEKLSLAADQGDADAQWQLASVLLMGTTGHKDEARAKVLAEKSAAQNSPEGMHVMSFLVPSGDDVPAETKAAARMEWLRKAADLGYVPAQLDWIMFYEAPLGVDPVTDPNERLIFDWLAAAAEKGWPMAQRSLHRYYLLGTFVTQDPAEARKWRLLAQHQPYHRSSPWDGSDPWARPDEEPYEVEGRRRAWVWLDAHPLQYWQVDD